MVTPNKALPAIMKWSGGKGAEIKNFCHHYPQNFSCFIEPFVGGGSVFFNLNFESNIIADVHKDLINFYVKVKEGFSKEIYNIVREWTINEATYYFVRDIYKPTSDVERAAVFLYLRRTCFRGMLRYNREGKFNIPWGRYKNVSFDDILNPAYENLLSKTDIYCTSFNNIFDMYNSEDHFVFLDPPYDSVFTDYGYCTFGKEEQTKLSNCFKNTSNKCLLIIGDTPFIRELYDGYIVDSYDKNYRFRIHSGRVGKEIYNKHLIIKNY